MTFNQTEPDRWSDLKRTPEESIQTITWINAVLRKPDCDIIVLVATPSPAEPVWLGSYSDETDEWTSPDGMPIAYRVTHWAEMPSGPNP